MATVRELIARPFTVYGMEVTDRQIADAIDLLANLPWNFEGWQLGRALLPDATGHERQEATNRLLQRWRKLGLVTFKTGRWTLARAAWPAMQTAARDVRAPSTSTKAETHE